MSQTANPIEPAYQGRNAAIISGVYEIVLFGFCGGLHERTMPHQGLACNQTAAPGAL